MEINRSSNFAHITRLPSKHIRDTEKEYNRSFACNQRIDTAKGEFDFTFIIELC